MLHTHRRVVGDKKPGTLYLSELNREKAFQGLVANKQRPTTESDRVQSGQYINFQFSNSKLAHLLRRGKARFVSCHNSLSAARQKAARDPESLMGIPIAGQVTVQVALVPCHTSRFEDSADGGFGRFNF